MQSEFITSVEGTAFIAILQVKAAVDLAGDGPVQKLSDSLKVCSLQHLL